MYYVNKIVGWCLSPMGLFFVALAVSLCLCRCGGQRPALRRAGRGIAVAACLALWLFSTGAVMRVVGLPLEGEEIDLDALSKADAIVLLGGGMMVHAKCGAPEICSSADRVWAAARLFKKGKAPVLIASGQGAPAELALLNDFGVDTNKVVRLEEPRNTEEEASLIARTLKDGKIILVTSAWHMPRAKMLFERKGLDVITAPTDYEFHSMAEERWSFGDFLPNAEAQWRNAYAVKEWVARACYWVKR